MEKGDERYEEERKTVNLHLARVWRRFLDGWMSVIRCLMGKEQV